VTTILLTSCSGFGKLLLPYNNAEHEGGLTGFTFHLDRRMDAIVAEEDFGITNSGDNTALLGDEKCYSMPAVVDNCSPLSRMFFKEKVKPDSH